MEIPQELIKELVQNKDFKNTGNIIKGMFADVMKLKRSCKA